LEWFSGISRGKEIDPGKNFPTKPRKKRVRYFVAKDETGQTWGHRDPKMDRGKGGMAGKKWSPLFPGVTYAVKMREGEDLLRVGRGTLRHLRKCSREQRKTPPSSGGKSLLLGKEEKGFLP